MRAKNKNHWKPWTDEDERRLVQLAAENTPAHTIARQLDRSENAIRNKAIKLGVPLPPHQGRKGRAEQGSDLSNMTLASSPARPRRGEL
jgi:hypothetical protein